MSESEKTTKVENEEECKGKAASVDSNDVNKKDETGGDVRKDEMGGDIMKDETGGDITKDETDGDIMKDETGGDITKDETGSDITKDEMGGDAAKRDGNCGRAKNNGNDDAKMEVDVAAVKCEKKAASPVKLIVVYNKVKHDVSFDANRTVKQLKKHLESVIEVPCDMQKIMFKGLAKDDQKLKDLDMKDGSKIMVVGSKLKEVLAAVSTSSKAATDTSKEGKDSEKEPWSKQKIHKKVLDKGKPDDAMESLPPTPLYGMLNKHGGKVRLTFKLEMDQLWIGTKERTEKVAMNTIKSVVNQAIEGNEEYHIVAFQLGTTELSRYWVYWVPAQYVEAIKTTIFGKWNY